jgi:hypothetical protein
MSRPILALVGLSSAVVATACIASHAPPPPAIAIDVRQLDSIAGAMADYARTDKITIVRDEAGRPVSFRFPARPSKRYWSAEPKDVMEDEWTSVISGHRLVKFTYVDLPEGEAFLTAQIAGHAVVYSVILRTAVHPFNREGVERHFDYECPPLSN